MMLQLLQESGANCCSSSSALHVGTPDTPRACAHACMSCTGLRRLSACVVVPMATGMSCVLVLLSLRCEAMVPLLLRRMTPKRCACVCMYVCMCVCVCVCVCV
jgi:hypothetical protein